MHQSILIFLIWSILIIESFAQQQILTIGNGQALDKNDSTKLAISLDLNRIPGQSEKAGGFYFVNNAFGPNSLFGYYIKPTIDINLGSAVSSSPNNISIGLPIGIVYDFKKSTLGIYSWYFDVAPEIISDKSLNNILNFVSINTYFKYELNNSNFLLNILIGISNANGIRKQTSLDLKDRYGRLTMPLMVKVIGWNASTKRTVNGVEKGKDFKRINWTNIYKLNHVYSDNELINTDNNYQYFTSKLDFFVLPHIGVNITYYKGKEEPLFKNNNSLLLGLTIAK